MPLIEGLGDEVTLVLGALFVCVIASLAWFSTHTADLPALRGVGITVIERTQIRRRVIAQPTGGDQDQNHTRGNRNLTTGLVESVSTRPASETSPQNNEDGNARSSQETTASAATEDTNSILSSPLLAPSSTNTNVGGNSEIFASTQQSSDPEQTPLQNAKSEKSTTVTAQSSDDPAKLDEHDKEEVDSQAAGATCGKESISEPVNPEKSSDQHVEEELRRRRVHFFQNSSSLQSATGRPREVSETCTEAQEAGISQQAASRTQSLADSLSTSPHLSNTGSASTSPPQAEHSSPNAKPTTDSGSPSIRVKLKYMNETQRMVYTSPLDTIGNFRRTHFQQELQEEDKWVRFIYNGQDLRDDEATLQAYQVGDNCTMHCLITNKRRTPTAQGGSSRRSGGGPLHGEDEDSDSVMGALMYPLFTLVLAVVWYFRLTYRQYFSPMSTVCLIGISFLLGLGYFSSLRTTTATTGNQQQQQQQGAPGTGENLESRQNHRTTAAGHGQAE